ncbi:MAG: YggS family pyridoxal phosphate-dependent enzyme [Rhodospirillales bacterium]|nr:YggS family pyridoxal phosphate-dependent enzyme [Rhodospirillales bacterium]|tara:strand:- start:526 stop:1194 length:669 start_codon:yes stop_codon:yes gene_type:complete
MTADVIKNIDLVEYQISEAAKVSGRLRADITLIAVSKGQTLHRIDSVLSSGQLFFGENRVQEAQKHWLSRRKNYQMELHLIGPLQSNKVTAAVELFDVIQTLDRPKLVVELVKAFDKLGFERECFVQINTGEEAQKNGIIPEQADSFIAYCRSCGIPVSGLMCIPPASETSAPHFALLKTIAERNGVLKLSMGMSADFETAINLGATHIRVGTAVFGPRPVL